ncbi:MAG: gephyrin-like molybdotransferase Glp [Acidobacteriota bacterium]
MLPIQDALSLILEHVPLLATERIPLGAAQGRVLREDVISDIDLPPFDRARMDGYAVRHLDTVAARADAKVWLHSIGEAVAGHAFNGTLTSFTAVRIMTGAPLPAGADSVEKIEVIDVLANGDIELREPVQLGRFITPRGSEALQGTLMVGAGAQITPATAAVLASFGYSLPNVSRRPQLALISTGSELVEVGDQPGPSQIRNSNTYSLAGYATAAGAEVSETSIIGDDLETTREAIARGAETADVVMLSGGVSMGDLDLVKPALLSLGAELLVERVAMHPGKPTVFARLGEKIIFGLPGNPVSVAVAFHIFARPALLKMQGATVIDLPRFRAIVGKSVKGAPPRRSHQPASISIVDGQVFALPLRWGGSSDLVAFMHADALIVVPESRARLEEGELADVISLRAE